MMRRGWWPYWWNVLMRSWKDAGKFASVIGISLPKLIWGFAAILIVFVGGAVIFEQTNTEKLWWAAGTFGTGLIALLVFFVPCLTRAPWQIENEIVEQHTKEKASWEAKISGLSSELAEIRKILEARAQREAEARNKVRRNSRLKVEAESWIKSGLEIMREIEQSQQLANIAGPEMAPRIQVWITGAHKFVVDHFGEFLERFESVEGFPPRAPIKWNGGMAHWRDKILNKVERLQELLAAEFGDPASHWPDASPPNPIRLA